VSAKCLLCDGEFAVVNWSHLKSAHDITTDEYLEMFPGVELCSEEVRRRVSGSMLGNRNALGGPGSEGYTHTEEAKRAISEAVRESKLGNQYALGHTCVHTEETRKRMSETMKEHWKDPEFAKMVSELQHRRPNGSELRLQTVLDKRFPGEWRYVGDGQFWIEGRNPDFMNVDSRKQVIEVFGVYWHDPTLFPDRLSEEELVAHYRSYGFDCLVFWEYDVFDEDEVAKRVSKTWHRE